MTKDEFQAIDWDKPHWFRITYAYPGKRYGYYGPATGHVRFGATIKWESKGKRYGKEEIHPKESFFPCEMLWECDSEGNPLKPYPKGKRPAAYKVCKWCWKTFYPEIGQDNKYCCPECRKKAEDEKKAKKELNEQKKRQYKESLMGGDGEVIEKQCRVCGKFFKTRSGVKVFCSYECFRKDLARKEREAYKKRKELQELRECKYCGKKFVPDRAHKIYCSWDCRTKAEKERAKRKSACYIKKIVSK